MDMLIPRWQARQDLGKIVLLLIWNAIPPLGPFVGYRQQKSLLASHFEMVVSPIYQVPHFGHTVIEEKIFSLCRRASNFSIFETGFSQRCVDFHFHRVQML